MAKVLTQSDDVLDFCPLDGIIYIKLRRLQDLKLLVAPTPCFLALQRSLYHSKHICCVTSVINVIIANKTQIYL